MSNKIKIQLEKRKKLNKKKPEQDFVEKISISLGDNTKKQNYQELLPDIDTKKSLSSKSTIRPLPNIITRPSPSHDKDLHKLFKNNNYHKLDLHGYSLENAKSKLISYCESNLNKNLRLHIIVTGLGNKKNDQSFFSGKIRNAFESWINESPLRNLIYGYSSCKVQHGGLGAFYIKLRVIR